VSSNLEDVLDDTEISTLVRPIPRVARAWWVQMSCACIVKKAVACRKKKYRRDCMYVILVRLHYVAVWRSYGVQYFRARKELPPVDSCL
jgi:hypothetical protein